MSSHATPMVSSSPRRGRRTVILLDRDDGRDDLELVCGDDILIELKEIPEVAESCWRLVEAPEGVFMTAAVYISDGSFYKNGHRKPEAKGLTAERRFVFWVSPGGSDEGRFIFENDWGLRWQASGTIRERLSGVPPSSAELLELFRDRGTRSLNLRPERDGVYVSYSGCSRWEKNHRAPDLDGAIAWAISSIDRRGNW